MSSFEMSVKLTHSTQYSALQVLGGILTAWRGGGGDTTLVSILHPGLGKNRESLGLLPIGAQKTGGGLEVPTGSQSCEPGRPCRGWGLSDLLPS